MADALRDRGPSSHLAADTSPAVLGAVHRGGGAPITRDGLGLSADVRLDDRAGLAALLGLSRADLADRTDADLVLLAYRRWGTDCVRHLIGAFAFALWDPRAGQLLLARDHIGMRPLYYGQAGDLFVFASTPAAVVAGTGEPARPDEIAVVARMVSHHGILRERAFVDGVRKLPPGETLTVRPGGAPVRSAYWVPGPRPLLSLGDRREYAGALAELLDVCAGAATAGERPVAAHLSGGLDSSAVAVVAQRALAARGRRLVRGFSWSPPPGPDADRDERARVLRLAELLGVPVSWTPITPDDLQADLARDLALEPNAATIYEQRVLAAAAREGIGVILSGWGGDEGVSFNGGGHLACRAMRGRPTAFFRHTLASGRRADLRGARLARHLAVRTLDDVLAPMLPDGARRRLGRDTLGARRERRIDWAALHPLAPDMRREAQARLRDRSDARAGLVAWMGNGHLTTRLEGWAHLAGPHDLEYRFPLLDRRLLDLCLSFPDEVWAADGYKRWVFRKAMEGVLPADLVWGVPKAEPSRIGSFLELYCDGWEPAEAAGAVDAMVVAHRRTMQASLRTRAPGARPAGGRSGPPADGAPTGRT
jgi:asparagine synthase (glutamine-hydrolysing)